jgi:LysR family transcriptional regulator, transcriptional activator of the cysJI operon
MGARLRDQMSDEKIKTFLTVVRYGSITQAAKELYISQPAVTSQIHKLEQEYKEALFYRREKGVELTPAGKVLYDYALRINRLYDEALGELGVMSGDLRGALHLGATLTIGEYVLPSVMGHFKSTYPHVDLLLQVENTVKIVDQVASGILDFGLVEGPFENGSIRREKLADDELIAVCSIHHRLAEFSKLDLDTLCNESLILREPGSGTRRVFEDALHHAGVNISQLKVMMQIGSTQAIKALVAENLGLAVISRRTVETELQQGVFKRLEIPSLNLHRTFNFIFKKDVDPSFLTRPFITTCRHLVNASKSLNI